MKQIIDEAYKNMKKKREDFQFVYELEIWDIVKVEWIPIEYVWRNLFRTNTDIFNI